MELDLAEIHQLAAEQGIDAETLDESLTEALRLAYSKTPHAAKHARVELDDRAGTFTVWAQDEIPQEPTEEDSHPAPKLGEEYDDTPNDFGRVAAATARGVLNDLFREAEDKRIFGAFAGQKEHLITGVIQQDALDPNNVHVAVGGVEAILPKREQVPGERYRHGQRIRVYVVTVSRGMRGPEIVVSRSHPGLVRRLFELEVPELNSGAVSIMAIAREAGARTKIAVKANAKGVNPKGALIGPGGARVRAVMENLGEEKIDIVDWSAAPDEFIASALSPATVREVAIVSERNQTAIAYIRDSQLSLAIGKEGQNARLAAKLTGWKIGIESLETHQAKLKEQEAQAAQEGQTAQAAPAAAPEAAERTSDAASQESAGPSPQGEEG
ncbi:transcription termination factor NusA [Bifidobacterium actinocoloniiforme DSM 22766]|uniref:Transcription termination/antitermination protein NusA n=1 Tax=Bifidobacterium actinocoloniiforme DSM 22766 TaxID=1437605 RepID=A0A086YYT0_9BIFI|nr:transcription termination factor NusA [Bifidobacterium actinocoloniiforme]KFI39430.1 transcription termination factor NusA [Bifidobacterium actinocoloniiforme DSM 22766]